MPSQTIKGNRHGRLDVYYDGKKVATCENGSNIEQVNNRVWINGKPITEYRKKKQICGLLEQISVGTTGIIILSIFIVYGWWFKF